MSKKDTHVGLVLPSYNKGEELSQSIRRLYSYIKTSKYNFQVVVVNDCSTDDTNDVLKGLSGYQNLYVLNNEKNEGKGYSLKRGYMHLLNLSFDYMDLIGYIDADLDIEPTAIEKLCDSICNDECDAAIGSKYVQGSHLDYPRHRIILSKIFYFLASILLRLDINDSQAGLKIFGHSPLKFTLKLIKSNGYSFDLELLFILNRNGFRIKEFPISVDFRGKSTVNLNGAFKAVLDLFQIWFRNFISKTD